MKKIKQSMGNALRGMRHAFRSERNFRIHCAVAILVALGGAWLEWDYAKWAIAVLAIAAVLSAEMTNTAIEYTWNHLEPNHHPVIAAIKDVMAGAVLVMAIGAAIVGALLFLS
jgi:undecaprenol kinase